MYTWGEGDFGCPLTEQRKDFNMLKRIGAYVVALFLIALPILVTCSFVFNWYGGIKTLLAVLSLLEFLLLGSIIYEVG